MYNWLVKCDSRLAKWLIAKNTHDNTFMLECSILCTFKLFLLALKFFTSSSYDLFPCIQLPNLVSIMHFHYWINGTQNKNHNDTFFSTFSDDKSNNFPVKFECSIIGKSASTERKFAEKWNPKILHQFIYSLTRKMLLEKINTN